MNAPHSPEAEGSVVGQCLAKPRIVGEVVGTLLEPQHFFLPAFKALYHEIVAAYYADEPIDPVTTAELAVKPLARAWSCAEGEVVGHVRRLASQQFAGRATDHALIVKRDHDYRALLALSTEIKRTVDAEEAPPEEVASITSQTAMQIATSTLLTHEIHSFDDLGRRFLRQQRELMAARAQGVELGAYFGLQFLDGYLRGLRPTELFILAGEPGAGKSALAWKATQLFAERQMRKPENKRVGSLILSLEMGEEPSNVRLAQANTGIDGGRMREGLTDDDDLAKIAREWGRRKGLPLWLNFTSTLRSGQMRALIVEAIRRHNVGLVVIDHMRYFDMDGRYDSGLAEEEAKARFLKEQIAKDLNLAVVVLAHTTKAIEGVDDRRPRLSHLRGSGQVAAHADFVAFVYRPYHHAHPEAIDSGDVKRTDAELIFAKNRHGLDGISPFYFDPSTMTVAEANDLRAVSRV